jgi:hypothetical protein
MDPGFSSIQLPASVLEDKIVLQFSGLINLEGTVSLDLETIMSFPQTTFSSVEPWDNTIHEFAGVALFPLLKRIGTAESATKIDVIAANDYNVTISLEDIDKYEYMLAYEIDKQLFQENPDFKNRGVIIIAINFDEYEDLDVEVYKFHLVWQIKDIIVR